MGDLWASVLKRVSRRVGPKSFRDWFEPTRFRALDGNAVLVEVPNALFQEWMERNYSTLIEEVLVELREEHPNAPEQVRFSLPDGPAQSASPPAARSMEATDPGTNGASRSSALDQRYIFDNFVVGGCNQFAHAAARAVAESPGRTYNPLFLYGGVGLGKTHLMQAIGHSMLKREPGLQMEYVSAERFMCDMINAIRWKRQPEFRDRFRTIDVLLVDDVQFLEGKEATQEEFFHTFRTLYEEGKQIVLSSDRPPRELATLEERLRSRFECGLIADMQAPDLETKLAILNRKAETDGFELDDDVALFVASKVRSNVRELEGCLNRIMALASLRGRKPEVELAREATRGIFPEDTKQVAPSASLARSRCTSRRR
jgi:chromosomal replication initiator protein